MHAEYADGSREHTKVQRYIAKSEINSCKASIFAHPVAAILVELGPFLPLIPQYGYWADFHRIDTAR